MYVIFRRRYATTLLLFTNQMTCRHFASFFFSFSQCSPSTSRGRMYGLPKLQASNTWEHNTPAAPRLSMTGLLPAVLPQAPPTNRQWCLLGAGKKSMKKDWIDAGRTLISAALARALVWLSCHTMSQHKGPGFTQPLELARAWVVPTFRSWS